MATVKKSGGCLKAMYQCPFLSHNKHAPVIEDGHNRGKCGWVGGTWRLYPIGNFPANLSSKLKHLLKNILRHFKRTWAFSNCSFLNEDTSTLARRVFFAK